MTGRPENSAPADAGDIQAAIGRVRARIDAACRRAGREQGSVSIVAVTKGVPVGPIRVAVESGLTVLGENRVQEAEAKAAEFGAAEWHFLGRLQSNKVARAVRLFHTLESVGSAELAVLAARAAREAGRAPYPVFIQVNVDRDPAKGGVLPDEAPEAIARIAALGELELRGLMTVGLLVREPEAARASFAALRHLSAGLRKQIPRLGPGLSMGMSHDFEVAVEEGATVVRLGRVIFGARRNA